MGRCHRGKLSAASPTANMCFLLMCYNMFSSLCHVTHAYMCIRDETLEVGPIQISLILLLFSLLTKHSPLSVFHPTPSRCHCYIEPTVPSSHFPSFPDPHIDRAAAGASSWRFHQSFPLQFNTNIRALQICHPASPKLCRHPSPHLRSVLPLVI